MESTIRSSAPLVLGFSISIVLLNSCEADLIPSIQCTVAEDIFSSLWSVAMLRREHETLLSHLMAS